jgi:hypothetical protein
MAQSGHPALASECLFLGGKADKETWSMSTRSGWFGRRIDRAKYVHKISLFEQLISATELNRKLNSK